MTKICIVSECSDMIVVLYCIVMWCGVVWCGQQSRRQHEVTWGAMRGTGANCESYTQRIRNARVARTSIGDHRWARAPGHVSRR